MQKHPFFDLELIDNRQLEELLSTSPISRRVIQQWPLSCVELVDCIDHSKWIIKSNHIPCDIEGHFYRRISHPAVVKPITIIDQSPYQNIIYPYQSGEHPIKKQITQVEASDLYHNIRNVIDGFDHSDLPSRIDISTPSSLRGCLEHMIIDLESLISLASFTECNRHQIDDIHFVILDERLQDKWFENSGYAHGDLAADNVLIQNDLASFIILDWQRPILGPTLMDEYQFFHSLGFACSLEAKIIALFERVEWLVQCAMCWFPPGKTTYDITIHLMMDEINQAYEQFIHE